MYNFRRYFNQNRKTIGIIILIIVFVILIIQFLNWLTKKQNEKELARIEKTITQNNNNVSTDIISEKSSVTGETLDSTKIKNDTDIIKEFLDFCNNRNINNAYDLLSNDCKETNFSTAEDFLNIYYKPIFNGEKKTYTIENWVGNIYKVNITNDILSTGNTDINQTRQDYITVVTEENEKKLNINGLITKQTLNKEKEVNGVKINVAELNQYMDYTEYKIEITNDSNSSIILDTLQNPDSMYIEDSKNIKYSAYSHELSSSELLIETNNKKEINIKYYSTYSSTKSIEKIVFSRALLNYTGNSSANYSAIEIEI